MYSSILPPYRLIRARQLTKRPPSPGWLLFALREMRQELGGGKVSQQAVTMVDKCAYYIIHFIN